MILLGGNRDADDADGIEDTVADHRILDIKLVMVSFVSLKVGHLIRKVIIMFQIDFSDLKHLHFLPGQSLSLAKD